MKATETAVKRAHTEALPLALTLALDLDLINRLFATGQKEDNAEYRRQARNLCMLLIFSWSLGLGGNPVGLGLRCSAAFRCPRGQTGQHFRGGPGAGEQIYFPTFDPGEENGDPLSPALPLNLYDLGVGTLSASKQSKQRAAPLALRINRRGLLLSVPQDEHRQGPVLLPRQTLREFLANLYPDGHREWRKGKNLASLLVAIEALESSAARIPWQDETGRGGARRVIIPRDVPRSGHLDDYIQFAVDLPPRSGAQQGEAMSKDKREDDVKKRVREETEPIEHSYAPGEETGEARESRGIQGP